MQYSTSFARPVIWLFDAQARPTTFPSKRCRRRRRIEVLVLSLIQRIVTSLRWKSTMKMQWILTCILENILNCLIGSQIFFEKFHVWAQGSRSIWSNNQIIVFPAQAIVTPSPEILQVCHGERKNAKKRKSLAPPYQRCKERGTYHMSCSSNGGKSQQGRFLYLPCLLSVDGPIPPLASNVRWTSTPFQLVDPQLVRDPIALPIVGSSIDQYTHATVQEVSDVILSVNGPLVHVCVEAVCNDRGTRGETIRRFHAKKFTDFGWVQVGLYEVALPITEVAFAWLYWLVSNNLRIEVEGICPTVPSKCHTRSSLDWYCQIRIAILPKIRQTPSLPVAHIAVESSLSQKLTAARQFMESNWSIQDSRIAFWHRGSFSLQVVGGDV